MKNCSKCGAELPDEAKFCAECGEKSESVNQQEPVKALPEEKPAEPSSVSEAAKEPAKEAVPRQSSDQRSSLRKADLSI